MDHDLINQDQQQRAKALDPQQSFIVQAPAGSGKTELLIQRFLTLLNHVHKPEEILAITFTKKSANEMRTRVIKALKTAQYEEEPEAEHAKKTWRLARLVLRRDQALAWNLLGNPNQLSIQTIDSLCAYLTKQLPLLSHFGSSPNITENSLFLYQEAVREVLSHVEENYAWSAAIANLLQHLDNDLNKLYHLLTQLLARRDQWSPYLHLDDNADEIKQQLEKQLECVISDHLNYLSQLISREEAQEILAIAQFAAQQLPSTAFSLQQFPGTKPQDKMAWQHLANLLLTKSFTFRKKVSADIGFPALTQLKNARERALHQEYRQRHAALIASFSTNEHLRVALTELFFLPNPQYSQEEWQLLQALLNILKILSAQLRVVFQQQGQIDFIENAHAALIALGDAENPTDLALALDYQIKHILIDEFQDTSFTQYQLLQKLILGWEPDDGRTLFVVGDPMQSIYRFREAEVGLFIRMWQNGIGNLPLTPLTLSINFRSTSAIVAWNNAQFQQIFPSFNDIANGAVIFSPSTAPIPQKTISSTINITGLLNADEKKQAEYIVKQIQNTKRQSNTENMAILVRSRSHLSAIIPALKKSGIAYRAVDIDLLITKQAIQDLLSLTSALLHPADRIAWLAVLRAPWCGLLLSDLLILSQENPYGCLIEALANDKIIAQLSDDGKERAKKIYQLMQHQLAERERYPLRDWIEKTWQALGGPATLSAEEEINEAESFFKLLEDEEFTKQPITKEKLSKKMSQLYAEAQQEDCAVQIMTIHTAKGLEFDTIILPHLEKEMPYDDKSLLEWLERPLSTGQTALLLAPLPTKEPDSIYHFITRQKKIKADHEVERLLYVACTRAKKNIHIYFNTDKTQQEEIKTNKGSFLDKLWPCLEKYKDQILLTQPHDLNEDTQEKTARSIKRLTTTWQNPMPPINIHKITRHQRMEGWQWADHTPKIIGIVVHRVLQHMSYMGINWWSQQSVIQKTGYLKQLLQQQDIVIDQIAIATQACLQALDNTINDERGQWLLTQHQEACAEFSLTAMIEGKMTNLIIDRTFIDNTNTRWIIDYKTATLTQGELNKFLADEQEKYLKKMAVYYQAIKLIDPREIRVGLYFPMLPAWQEYEFS